MPDVWIQHRDDLQPKKFFVEEGFQTEKIADIEAKRGTSDPTYLYYTLGKLQKLKLRQEGGGELHAGRVP